MSVRWNCRPAGSVKLDITYFASSHANIFVWSQPTDRLMNHIIVGHISINTANELQPITQKIKGVWTQTVCKIRVLRTETLWRPFPLLYLTLTLALNCFHPVPVQRLSDIELLLLVWEAPSSVAVPEGDYLRRGFSWFSSVPPHKCWHSALK